jgi:hypothetical protein
MSIEACENRQHETIVFDSRDVKSCPLCTALGQVENLEGDIDSLKIEVRTLERDIDNLESQAKENA